MKKKLRGFFILLTVVLILGATPPAWLYAGGQTGEGNLWDPFVNTNPFNYTGAVKLTGTLTMIYNPSWLLNYGQLTNFFPLSCNGLGQAIMFYSARFNYLETIKTYPGATGVCLGDIGNPGSGGQGDVIMAFLGYVIPDVIGYTPLKWNLRSIKNAGISGDSMSFVADFVIMAK